MPNFDSKRKAAYLKILGSSAEGIGVPVLKGTPAWQFWLGYCRDHGLRGLYDYMSNRPNGYELWFVSEYPPGSKQQA